MNNWRWLSFIHKDSEKVDILVFSKIKKLFITEENTFKVWVDDGISFFLPKNKLTKEAGEEYWAI